MYYSVIKPTDIANGVGVRVTLFVSGCSHHCKGCFQPETWSPTYGQPFTKQTEDEIMRYLGADYIRGLTLLGGEPMEVENQRALLPLVLRVREQLPQKDIWCYSGYTWEELHMASRARCEVTDSLISCLDVLVDGEFVEEKRNISLRFRGSENQRLIHVPRTLQSGQIVWWNE